MFSQRERPATEAELQQERDSYTGPIDVDGMAKPQDDHPGTELVARDTYIPERPGEVEPTDKTDLFKGKAIVEQDAPFDEKLRRKHAILMDTLEEEGERQSEERQQAQIDHEYYDHQQWTAEQARVLLERGQAPLVFNESRAAIEWLTGTERRLRKDYKIRPREKNDVQIAEVKTNVFKYVDDVNFGSWHRSQAFKQMVISGLGWLEEGLNLDPEKEMIFCGSEDWRRVFRDSRGREFDQSDWRYIHRRKIIDLDYAQLLLPKAAQHLAGIAGRWGMEEDEAQDVWYLGQKLTSAHASGYMADVDGIMGDGYSVRRAGTGEWDYGRRNSVELIETWYRVPESCKVFADGPAFRKVYNPADPQHAELAKQRIPMYETVKWRMRIMISTKYQPLWDGPSPFNHGQFLLIPMWGYRRGRDGMTYGPMRGMRDPQDDLNKRKSKALYSLSVNQLTVTKTANEDLEELREENARADGMLVVDDLNNIRKEKFMGEITMNLEMAEQDRQHIRNAGGVTGDNLGQDSNASSGKAIIAKQEQGSLTTFELFDNFFLAFKMAGQRRMSHIEQFCNQPWVIRIDPNGNGPMDWLHVNELDPLTGVYKNDITRSQADFIVDQQDYRATLTQAAMQQMFELLGQIATFAPNVVLSLLDLVVDSADIHGKDVWVSRIRKLNGQRDPSKPPTPEEEAADAEQAMKQKRMEDVTIETAEAKLKEILAKVNDTNSAKVLKNLQAMLSAVEAAATATTMPGVAIAADGLARSAGMTDATPATPLLTAPEAAPGAGSPVEEPPVEDAVDTPIPPAMTAPGAAQPAPQGM